MSDRSYASVQFYRCTEQEWNGAPGEDDGVAYLIADMLDVGWVTHEEESTPGHPVQAQSPEMVVLGDDYMVEELVLGELAELLVVVHQQYPNVVFFGQQEARYEYPGDVIIATDLGLFRSSVDQSGNVTLRYEDVARLAVTHSTVAGLLTAVNELCGLPDYAEIERWRTQLREVTS